MEETRKRSKAWFILPVVMGIIGGVIAYFALRKDDKKMAKNCLIIGAALTGVGLLINGMFSLAR